MAFLDLVGKAAPRERLMPLRRIMSQIMPVPGLVCMAVHSGRLMPSGRIMSQTMSSPFSEHSTFTAVRREPTNAAHAAAGAWAKEPVGGLKSWTSSHETTPRPPK